MLSCPKICPILYQIARSAEGSKRPQRKDAQGNTHNTRKKPKHLIREGRKGGLLAMGDEMLKLKCSERHWRASIGLAQS
jgi:hypothetical protein